MQILPKKNSSRFRPPPKHQTPAEPMVASVRLEHATSDPDGSSLGQVAVAGLSLLGLTGGAQAAQTPLLEQVQRDPATLLGQGFSHEDQAALEQRLGLMAPELLQSLAQDGLVIIPLAEGESLLEKGLIETRDPQQLQAHSGRDAERLSQLPTTSWEAFDQQVHQQTQGRWRAFRPLGRSRDSYSVREISRQHGVQASWFEASIEAANHSQLKEARQRVMERTRLRAEAGDYRSESAAARLEEYQADPGAIPINWKEVPLAVPDWHKTPLGPTNRHDRETINRWQHTENGLLAPAGLEGQYFGDANTILLTPVGVERPKTVLHEVGHAVLRRASERWPVSSLKLKERLARARNGLVPAGIGIDVQLDPGHSHRFAISEYSRVNAQEYFAEGFAHYHTEPEILKLQDPLLFELVEEAIALNLGP